MAAQFDSAPGETYLPAKQTLMYTLSDSGGAVGTSHRFIVQVFENTTEIGKLFLVANGNNKAFFDLSKFVQNRLTLDHTINTGTSSIFDMAADIDHSITGTNKYQVKIGTFDGTTETLAEATKVVYLVDGTQQISEGLHPSFAKYYPQGTSFKSWLTERWDNKEVSGEGINSAIDYYFADNDEGVIAWIHDNTVISGLDTRVYYQLYNDAGTLGSLDFHRIVSDGGNALNATDYNEKIHFTGLAPASLRFTSTNLPSHANNSSWTFYLLWLADDSANRKSKYIRVNKDCGVYKNERVQIAYSNRVGGWDYLNFDGNAVKQENVTNKPFYKILGDFNASTFSYSPTDRNLENYQITSKNLYTLKSNSFRKEEFYQLEGLLRSDNVFMRYGDSDSDTSFLIDRDKWLPVTVNTKSLQINDKEQSRVFDVSLVVELAQDIRC